MSLLPAGFEFACGRNRYLCLPEAKNGMKQSYLKNNERK